MYNEPHRPDNMHDWKRTNDSDGYVNALTAEVSFTASHSEQTLG